MARSYRPVVRDQEFLLPPNMADWLPEDHLVWFVIDVVGQLDTEVFHQRSKRGGVGRQGYDPDMLLGLLLYAYAVGERSSRRIERLCTDHVAFRVLCGQDAPDHTTLARFRAAHEDAFAGLFAQVLRLAAQAGMVRVGVVSIDGTKIAANAARGANRTPVWLREEAQRLAEEIVAEAAGVDQSEDAAEAECGSDDDRLPPSMGDHSGRAARIAAALAELERQDALEREVDDAEQDQLREYLASVEAGTQRGGPPPVGLDPVVYQQTRIAMLERKLAEVEGCSGAEAWDVRRTARRALKAARAALIVAQQAAQTGSADSRARSARRRDRRAEGSRRRGGTGPSVNLSDPDSRLMTHGAGGGSVQGYNAQLAVSDDHLVLGVHLSQDANDTHCFTPTLARAMTTTVDLDLLIGTVLADAGYFTVENLTVPGPDRLIAPGKNSLVAREARRDPTNGPPPDDLDVRDQMRHRLREPENAELYKRRSATVETVIAHLKDQTGLRRFARRGLQAATSELQLAATALNMSKLHAAALRPT